MTETYSGGCQCGFVKYQVLGDIGRLVICHCTECQRQSASAFGMSLNIDATCFYVISGSLKTFQVFSDSGRRKTCPFCRRCGTRIYHDSANGFLSIKAGTLNEVSELTPSAHYWTSRKLPWVDLQNDVPSYIDDG